MTETAEVDRNSVELRPLGAHWDGTGVHFLLYSQHANSVELCLYDDDDNEERIPLEHAGHYIWRAYVKDVQPGRRYGYRVAGPYDPNAGHRFNPNKLLVDPYARAIAGRVDSDAPVFGYIPGDSDRTFDDGDDAAGVPKGVVIDPHFDWGDDAPPHTPLTRSVIYEVHVKGFTKQHPDIPEEIRGTYSGLVHPAALEHLTRLGVTAVELLPVHTTIDDPALVDRGLHNYWGYNTLGFFAPDARFSSRGDRGEQVVEFKEMVKALHAAGLEVILDVVYNHSCEGNEFGPTLSFRGIDNRMYYRLVHGNERRYFDYTGTGNTLATTQPGVLKLVMDSLRYWVTEMHVDGFRFDLATTLGRGERGFDPSSAFFQVIHQDPVLSRVKLIAEPWDIGADGYQVGHFPPLWSEWNGKYRDTVRRFWRGDDSSVDELAYRLTGSSDLYDRRGRGPLASINFITAHDGFTLADLVSYNEKHNEANGEDNADGTDDNNSWNCGAEGPTDDPEINALRQRQLRNFLGTIFFSQGVPMISGGSEIGRTQGGNNNAYCQDNEISWFNWDLEEWQRALYEYTRKVIEIRQRYPAFRRRTFFRGDVDERTGLSDITWLRTDGEQMTYDDWFTAWVRSLGILIAGDAETQEHLLLLINAHTDSVVYALPELSGAGRWEILLCTDHDTPPTVPDGPGIELCARSLMLLHWVAGESH